MNETEARRLVAGVLAACREASARILEIYGQADFEVERKDDASPLTAADMASHETLMAALAKLTPEIPVLSEESSALEFEARR